MAVVATAATAPRKRRPDRFLDVRAFDLLCLTMAAVVASHARHMPWWMTAVLGLTLMLRWWQRRRFGTRISWWARLPLLLLLVVSVIVTYGTIFGRQPGCALAVGLLVLKALESERLRDARTGVAFACFALMSALLFGQGLIMTAAVMIGLLPALACLRALQPGRHASAWRGEFMPILKVLAMAAPLALAAFVFLPRLSTPLWGAAPDTGQARTGVGDRMSPGDFTQLAVDDSPAFRVHFHGKPPPKQQRYFRGPVLWWFDGRTWSGAGRLSHIRHARPETMATRGAVYRYTVTMEPSHQHWLFALDTPLTTPDGAHMSAEHTLVRNKPVDQATHYSVRSAPGHLLAPHLRPAERAVGLELPAGFDPRAHALARQWRRTYHGDDRAIVRAALSMFHNQDFHYTLTPPALGRDSIDDFLFHTRSGFCEHYASAFTFLMRAAGIPARVVTGYAGGYWNPKAGYLLVRQSNAHAWSEVWLKGRGWTRFDPTAAINPERVSAGAMASSHGGGTKWYQHGWLKSLRNHWDVVNHWWNQAVIHFDALRQHGLLTPFGVRHVNTTMLLLALAASIIVLMVLAAAFTLLPRRRGEPLQAAMALLRQRLARAGVARRTSEGPTRFFARAARALPHERSRLGELETAWVRLRYAQEHPAPEAVRRFCRAVRDFRPRRVVK